MEYNRFKVSLYDTEVRLSSIRYLAFGVDLVSFDA